MEQFKGMNQEERGGIGDEISSYYEAKAKMYEASTQELLMQHEIRIKFLSRGCVIDRGCKSIPFSSTEDAIEELKKYFDNPNETKLRWRTQLA